MPDDDLDRNTPPAQEPPARPQGGSSGDEPAAVPGATTPPVLGEAGWAAAPVEPGLGPPLPSRSSGRAPAR
ncbi:hypothetical protein [Cellulomonas persica]